MEYRLHLTVVLATLGAIGARAEGSAQESALDRLLARHEVRSLVARGAEDAAAPPAAPSASFSFLVGGHLYGDPENHERVGPAASFTTNVDALRASRPAFFVSLGDLFRGPSTETIRATLDAVGRLDAPVYNAVGNHDVALGDDASKAHAVYVEHFGPTFGGFRRGASLFLVLDTEHDPWRIGGEQLAFLRGALEAAPDAGIERVFLFAHRVLFATGTSPFGVVFRHCNSRQSWPGASNFEKDVLPLLEAFRETGDVTWFSGDVGVRWSYGLFHDVDPRNGIRYVAVGLGDQEWDSLVRVDVDASGAVELERVPLTDASEPRLDACGVAAWSERFAKPRGAPSEADR